MASPDLHIRIRADFGVMPAQLRCLAGAFNPHASDFERLIEQRAFEALCEIQRMTAAARRALGLHDQSEVVEVRMQDVRA